MQPLRGEKEGREEGGGDQWDRRGRGMKGKEGERVRQLETDLRPDQARTCDKHGDNLKQEHHTSEKHSLKVTVVFGEMGE